MRFSFLSSLQKNQWMDLNCKTIHYSIFPKYKESLLIADDINYPIAINGKKKMNIMIDANLEKDQIEQIIVNNEKIKKSIIDKKVQKIIIIPKKIINIVVK